MHVKLSFDFFLYRLYIRIFQKKISQVFWLCIQTSQHILDVFRNRLSKVWSMLRTEEAIVEVVSRDWSNITNMIKQRTVETFQTCPHYFFTEHDIHSVLYNITNEELQLGGVLEVETRDRRQVTLVHHEYPTPFRCDMRGYGFDKKDEKPYKRGHYDLVILNPNFVRNNGLDVVCGKDYQKNNDGFIDKVIYPAI